MRGPSPAISTVPGSHNNTGPGEPSYMKSAPAPYVASDPASALTRYATRRPAAVPLRSIAPVDAVAVRAARRLAAVPEIEAESDAAEILRVARSPAAVPEIEAAPAEAATRWPVLTAAAVPAIETDPLSAVSVYPTAFGVYVSVALVPVMLSLPLVAVTLSVRLSAAAVPAIAVLPELAVTFLVARSPAAVPAITTEPDAAVIGTFLRSVTAVPVIDSAPEPADTTRPTLSVAAVPVIATAPLVAVSGVHAGSSSIARDAPVPSVCAQEILPVAPAVERTSDANDIEQSLPPVLVPSPDSVSVDGVVAVRLPGASVSLLVQPIRWITIDPSRAVVIPACASSALAFGSPTGVPNGVVDNDAPLNGSTYPDADPVQLPTVIVLLAVFALARFHQIESDPFVAAFTVVMRAHVPAPSLSTHVGLAVASRFVMPMTRMSLACTPELMTTVNPVVFAPELAVPVPLVIATHYATVNMEPVQSVVNVSPICSVTAEP